MIVTPKENLGLCFVNRNGLEISELEYRMLQSGETDEWILTEQSLKEILKLAY